MNTLLYIFLLETKSAVYIIKVPIVLQTDTNDTYKPCMHSCINLKSSLTPSRPTGIPAQAVSTAVGCAISESHQLENHLGFNRRLVLSGWLDVGVILLIRCRVFAQVEDILPVPP